MTGTIPRTAVLLTLGSASLIWVAVSALSGVMIPGSGVEGLYGAALASGFSLIATGLFSAASFLSESAREADARARAVRVRVTAQGMRAGR